jgi:hypothetical protein
VVSSERWWLIAINGAFLAGWSYDVGVGAEVKPETAIHFHKYIRYCLDSVLTLEGF